ncbi:chemotaxis protein CheW [Telmatospirillum sp.]|uniref:chemotaxis protein CheW n=1 Tax=Telmatospirillum sp. TaxID=2079197 RepID=UPI002843FAFB|nr:chemotaxis protein CheW [Telmatospirillum sp.]MDR3437988.1 chemotaxis protein CheW [Telmatospirillum sp.]
MAVNDNQTFEALTFALGGEIFAINANLVREILDMIPQTEVPGSRPFVGGLINVRGKVVPLADLRIKFDMKQTPPTIDSRIVVVEIPLDGEPTMVGLLTDKVYEVTEIGGASIEDTPDIGMRWRPDFIKGIGKRRDEFIVIPNIERIFTSE